MRRIAVRLALATLALAASAQPVHAAGPDRKAIEALATAWAKARPKTRFVEWDFKVRADLLAQAKALGPIAEGSLDDVRDVFWKAIRASRRGRDAVLAGQKMATPYGEAKWIQNGRGGGKSGLVIGLHGGGEGAGDMGEAAGKWSLPGCVGLYPQGIRLVHDTWNTVHGERFVLTLIESAKVELEVDPDRVYAMGFSMGGTGSWFFAGRHPDLLAGAMPCAGVLMAAPKSQVATKEEVAQMQHGFVPNVRNLAMYWFTGLADRNCMPGTYLYAWDLLQDLRSKDVDGYRKLEFRTVPGLAHAFPPGEPNKGFDWIQKHRREALPKTLVWEQATEPYPLPETDLDRKVGRLGKLDFYWLHVEQPVDKAEVRATIAGNVVDLSIAGAAANDFTVWLRPGLVDVAQDVVVRVNGAERQRARPVPDVLTVLETLDARLDRTLTFDRRIRVEGP